MPETIESKQMMERKNTTSKDGIQPQIPSPLTLEEEMAQILYNARLGNLGDETKRNRIKSFKNPTPR